MIVCICRGKSDRDVNRAIEAGATSVTDLMRCGIGTDCGSCHTFLRKMLAQAAEAAAAAPDPCPACTSEPAAATV